MKIGIVTTWFARGAAYVSRQYLNVLKEEHDVYIYARGGESYAKGDPEWDFDYVTWGKKNWEASTAVNLKDFKKWILTKQLDIVFFNEQKWWPAIELCNSLGVLNGAYMDYYKENTLAIYGMHDFLICNTQRHLSAFNWHPGACYIPWGTDTELFAPDSFDMKDSEKLVFFHSAGMAPGRKGSDILIESIDLMKEKSSKLVLHSQVQIEEKYPQLKDIISKLKKQGRLEIIEGTVEPPGLYHKGDIYVYPTRLEGIGLTIAEALSCGLPSVVPDWPPMNEFVQPHIGRLVEVDTLYCRADGYYWPMNNVSPEKLAESLDNLVAHRSTVPEMKKMARKYAVDHLDWNKNSSKILKCFNQAHPGDVDFKAKATILGKKDFNKSNNLRAKIKRSFLFRCYKAMK